MILTTSLFGEKNAYALTPAQLCIRNGVRRLLHLQPDHPLSPDKPPQPETLHAVESSKIKEIEDWIAINNDTREKKLLSMTGSQKVSLLLDMDAVAKNDPGKLDKDSDAVLQVLANLRSTLTPSRRIELLQGPSLKILPSNGPTKSGGSIFDRTIDAVAGFNIEENEKASPLVKSSDGKNAKWSTSYTPKYGSIEYNPRVIQSYMTPYRDIENALKMANLKDGETVCDLGTAYGRPGVVIGLNHPQNKFIGLEINRLRIKEAERVKQSLGFANVELHQFDLSMKNAHLPDSDVYFLYDPVNNKTLSSIMAQLKAMAKSGKKFRIVAREGDGGFIQKLDALGKGWFKNWLRPVAHQKGISPIPGLLHTEDLIVYETVP